MPVRLTPLPYAKDALEPAISAETLGLHHGKHHKSYVDKTNELVAGTDLDNASLGDIVLAAAGNGNADLFNQSAQAWNHGFYWHALSPKPSKPDEDLLEAIKSKFGSLPDIVEHMVEEGAGHFGSGWVWLVAHGSSLAVRNTHDAGCPIVDGERPLLVLDVWEHAYYLDHRNDRKAYLKAAAKLLDWDFAAANFASSAVWTYPA